MNEFCHNEGIPYMDLTGRFRDAAEHGRLVYFAFDCHWNALGNQIAAEEIESFLRPMVASKAER